MILVEEEKSIWFINDEQSIENFSSLIIKVLSNSSNLGTKYKSAAWYMYAIIFLIDLVSLFIIFLLIYIFKKNKSLIKNSVNIFILNLVFVDLLRCLIQLPIYSLSIHFTFSETYQILTNLSYTYLTVLCNLNIGFNLLFEIVQLLSFLAISYERYKIVGSPFLNSNKRLSLAKILLIFTWFLGITLTITFILVISLISNFQNFSSTKNSCYLDVFSLAFDMYYNTNSKQLLYEQTQVDLRNKQNDIVDYFHLIFSIISFSITGYFYTRIILFLKFHEKNLFTLAKGNNKVEPINIAVNSPVVSKGPTKKPKYAIVNENGIQLNPDLPNNFNEIGSPPKNQNEPKYLIVDENGIKKDVPNADISITPKYAIVRENIIETNCIHDDSIPITSEISNIKQKYDIVDENGVTESIEAEVVPIGLIPKCTIVTNKENNVPTEIVVNCSDFIGLPIKNIPKYTIVDENGNPTDSTMPISVTNVQEDNIRVSIRRESDMGNLFIKLK